MSTYRKETQITSHEKRQNKTVQSSYCVLCCHTEYMQILTIQICIEIYILRLNAE